MQKVFFEDALLGQAKLIDNILAEEKRIVFSINKFLSFMSRCFEKNSKVDVNIPPSEFESIIVSTKLEVEFKSYEKLVFQHWFGPYGQVMIEWINIVEENAFLFEEAIKLLIINLRKQWEARITKEPKDFKKYLENIKNLVHGNYISLYRETVLLKFFSELSLEMANASYKNLLDIKNFPCRSEKCKLILDKMLENFRILYGFYVDNHKENIWYSYAVTSEGKRVRVVEGSEEADLVGAVSFKKNMEIKPQLGWLDFPVYLEEAGQRKYLGSFLLSLTN